MLSLVEGKESIERVELVVPRDIGPEGAAVLFGTLPPGAIRVRRLLLRGARIGDAGVEALARELEANADIAEIDLRENSVTHAGVRALAHALRGNSTLRRLDLRSNGVVGVDAVAEALAASGSLERLSVAGAWPGGDSRGVRALLGAAVAHPSLTGLFVDTAPIDTDAATACAELLRATRSLRRLALRQCLRGDAAAVVFVDGLRHAATLTHLNLSSSPLGDGGAARIAAALSLESCALEFVEVTMCGIGAAGAAAVADALRANRTLTRLNVGGNGRVGDEGARALFEALEENRTLTVLQLGACSLRSVAAVAAALEANRSLAVLDLAGNWNLGHDGVLALAAALRRPGCALEALDVSMCGAGDGAGRALVEALAANPALTAMAADNSPQISDGTASEIRAAVGRNRRAREEAVARRGLLCREAMPWIAADVLLNIVAEYAARGWSSMEVALHERTGSHFLPEDKFFDEAMNEL